MRDIRERLGTAIVLITHDLGVVADIADRVVVMYAGRKVEEAPVRELFARPQHPYTSGCSARSRAAARGGRRACSEIPGRVPSLRGCPRLRVRAALPARRRRSRVRGARAARGRAGPARRLLPPGRRAEE